MKRASGHRNGAGNRVTVYERVTERVAELLSQGVVPWQKPWHAKVGPPRNGVSGRYYRGLNVFMLSHAGCESPWWFTPKQVNDLGGHIVKGEKVSWAHFWKPWVPKSGPAEPLEVEADEAEISTRRPLLIVRAYRVVNLDQIAGPGADKFRDKHPPVSGPVNDNDPIAAFLCAMAGIDDPTIQNSASYINSWLRFLKTDPKALVVAGAQAQKASNFILGAAGVEEVEAPALGGAAA